MDTGGTKIKNLITRYAFNRYVLSALVFIIFIAANWSIYGPAYLSDEVAYLNKAATLAGQTVQVTSSWFGGYSILITPAFLVTHDPFIQWKLILLINGAMWAGTTLLLYYTLQKLRPEVSERSIAFATVGAMLYPAWISMSGYAFATSGFVFVFMVSLACLLRSKLTHPGWLSVAALAAGFLFWIHPLGAIYTLLLAILICLAAVVSKRWKLLIAPLVGAATGASYIAVVSPAINHMMNGNNSAHYAGTFKAISETVLTSAYWERFTLLILGLVFSLLIASFGILAISTYDALRRWRRSKQVWLKKLIDLELAVPLLIIATVIGVILINSASIASNQQIRLDEWVYGRYVDMFILPLIGLGLLATWRQKPIIVAILLVITTGIILTAYTNPQNTHLDLLNKVNIQGFWPMHITALTDTHEYAIWGVLGALGIGVTLVAAKIRKKTIALALLVPILLCGAANLIYHQTILRQHSTVSTPLYSYLTAQHTKTDCIGFTPLTDSQERFSLYSYYLHGYDVRTMPVDDWLKQDCKGPYFTYDKTIATKLGLSERELDNNTGLLMLTSRPANLTNP